MMRSKPGAVTVNVAPAAAPAPAGPRDYRQELWIGVAVAVARAEATKDRNAPVTWADHALRAFDARFGSGL